MEETHPITGKKRPVRDYTHQDEDKGYHSDSEDSSWDPENKDYRVTIPMEVIDNEYWNEDDEEIWNYQDWQEKADKWLTTSDKSKWKKEDVGDGKKLVWDELPDEDQVRAKGGEMEIDSGPQKMAVQGSDAL